MSVNENAPHRSPKSAAQKDQLDPQGQAHRQEDEEQAEAALVADVAEAAHKEAEAETARRPGAAQHSRETPMA